MKKRFLWAVVATAVVVVLTAACSGKAEREADQMMEAAHKVKDYHKMLSTADSLERAGVLSAVKANYWRGYAYDRLKQKDQAERYWKASMEAGQKTKNRQDVAAYAKSASRLANLLSVRGSYDETLKMAIPAAARIEELKCDTMSDYINLLIYIGCCQAVTGQKVDEAQHGFYRAYEKHLENIKRKHTDASYKDAIAGLINVVHYCVKAEKYEDALYYTRNFGELLGEYEMRPDASAEYVDRQLGRYDIYKAQALSKLGRQAEADETFEAFQATEFSSTPEGLSLAADYQAVAAKDEVAEQ